MPILIDALCAVIGATLKINKEMAALLLLNSKEIAALRESVKGLDPTFADTYQRERNQADKNSKFAPLIAQLQNSIDDTIRSLDEARKLLED